MRSVMTRAGKRIYILSASDLDMHAGGERLRAFCPIHGSDHQRSLSIDADSGWGYCHCCHATVLVEEYAPEVAETVRRHSEHVDDSLSGLPHVADLRRTLASRTAQPRPPAARPQWQHNEVAALCATWPLMRDELAGARVSAYLDERGIPPEIARMAGIGYLSRAVWEAAPVPDEQRHLLSRWVGRIVFPLGSPDGRGFIGRSLWYWEPGMDENKHKAILEERDSKRWIKTNPAGWFGPHPSRFAPTLILVEGGFDRLALITAGIPSQALVALVGTAANVEWIARFAPQVRRVVLALDGDEGGRGAMERLADEFQQAGLVVVCCPPPPDGAGKDWSERYRRSGQGGIWPLIEHLTESQA
jgi:DNA primase